MRSDGLPKKWPQFSPVQPTNRIRRQRDKLLVCRFPPFTLHTHSLLCTRPPFLIAWALKASVNHFTRFVSFSRDEGGGFAPPLSLTGRPFCASLGVWAPIIESPPQPTSQGGRFAVFRQEGKLLGVVGALVRPGQIVSHGDCIKLVQLIKETGTSRIFGSARCDPGLKHFNSPSHTDRTSTKS
jgi:hypothetical protein